MALCLAVAQPCAADPATLPPEESVPPLGVTAPPLTALRDKIADPNWLVAWLLQPSRLRPGTSMPDHGLTADESQVIAAYLWAGNRLPDKGATAWRGGDPRRGEQLFVLRGCRGCHALTPSAPSISTRVPNLAGIGLKVRGDWLFNWLKSPRAYNPRSAMPRLALSDDDIRHLTAFLLSRRDGAGALAAAPRFHPNADPAAGRAAIERQECAACHAIRGLPAPPPADELRHGSDASADALDTGRRLVAFYNCRGCHRIEGRGAAITDYLERKSFAPPTLDGEGARVQTSWLIPFLQHPTTLRPWLQMRMPDFGLTEDEAVALAKYFAVLANVPPVDEPYQPASDDLTTRGLHRFAHFKCVQCHPTSVDPQRPADADPENLSINLTLAKTRLRPSWIRQFLARPKAFAGTQTRMPAVFYDVDGAPKVEQPQQDIEAIAAYLLQMTEPPEATLARRATSHRVETPKEQTDWTKVPY